MKLRDFLVLSNAVRRFDNSCDELEKALSQLIMDEKFKGVQSQIDDLQIAERQKKPWAATLTA